MVLCQEDRSWDTTTRVVHQSHLSAATPQYAALFTADTDTMRSFFAQQDHMQVFNFILDCLDFLNI